MQIEQAVFTSVENSRMKGYQLVSRSRGIDRRVAQELCRWAPSHASLLSEELDQWSLNYFPVCDGWIAVTRTLYGGPEYSGRGTQVVTMHLVLRVEQFANFDFDALSLIRTALAMGHLRLPTRFAEQVPPINLHHRPFKVARDPELLSAERQLRTRGEVVVPGVPAAAIQKLMSHQQIALVGPSDPVSLLEQLIEQTPIDQRVDLSFTTKLKPSARRKFLLHFLPATDAALEKQLKYQGITSVPLQATRDLAPI